MAYDVIIAGGGPAGLTAAVTAASEGLTVLLVDTKEHIARHTRPCCSMWILEPGFHDEGWTFKDNKIYFHRNDFYIPYEGGTVDLHWSTRISSQGHTMVMGKKLTPIAKVIDKQKLLGGLFDSAVRAGVEIRSKTTCLAIDEGQNDVKAKLRHHGNEEWIAGKYLLAADGVDSNIVHSLGLNQNRKMLIRTKILYYYFSDVKTPYPNSWTQFIGDDFNGVSGTLLHKPDYDGYKDVYEIGAHPPLGSKIGLKESMQRLLAHPMLKEWFSKAHLVKKMGCRWTCWTPIAAPARDRVIIVGDSASFQEVENQGAIMCGFRAAKALVAKESGAEEDFKEYNQFWQRTFGFNDPQILKDTWKGFVLRLLGNENIDYILSLSEGRVLDGYVNHFKCGNVIFDFIKSQLPKIEKEKPELAERVKKLAEFKLEENMFGDVSTASVA